MRLLIQREQADRKGVFGGHRGVAFTLRSKVQFNAEERSLLDHYKMWDYTLFSRGQVPVTIRNLASGDSQTVENVEILLRNEKIMKQALDQVPPLLEVLNSFGGQTIIEYPRSSADQDEG